TTEARRHGGKREKKKEGRREGITRKKEKGGDLGGIGPAFGACSPRLVPGAGARRRRRALRGAGGADGEKTRCFVDPDPVFDSIL
ncbi:MAG: hypothetical protein JXA15_00790, partial [Spirochaetales bacterium]|nr:hypothetical protein [Spirochaetales bacterium]